jgi:hypothetical protein
MARLIRSSARLELNQMPGTEALLLHVMLLTIRLEPVRRW